MAKGIVKKGIMSMIMSAAMPILIIVLVASLIFSVFQGIIDIISGIVTAIVDILKDPIGTTREIRAKHSNALADIFNIGSFDIEAYRDYNVDAQIFMSLDEFKNMSATLKNSINTNVAGLDDITLKNMLLAYYRTIHLKDTELYIELTEEEYKEKDVDKIFEKVKVKQTEDGEKLPYLKTTGTVIIKSKDKDGLYKNMAGFSLEGLRKIYLDEYITNLDDDGEENWYASEVRKALGRCYNVDGNSIKMIEFNFDEIDSVYEYEDADIKVEEEKTVLKTGSTTEPSWITIDYATDISGYSLPLEFLTSLMEISQSKEFIYEIMKLVKNNTEIEVRLYDIETINETEIIKEYTQDVQVTANGKTKNDIGGKVKVTETRTSTEHQFKIGIKKSKVWHSEVEYEHEISSEEKKYYTDENGNKIYTADKDNNLKVNLGNEPVVVYQKSENYEMFNMDSEEETYLNELFKYTIKKSESGYDYEDYDFNQMRVVNKNIVQSTLNTVEEQSLIIGISKIKDKTDDFLELLIKNKKKQKYESLYGGKSTVGELLVNGEEMLYQLLESSPNSQGTVDIVKYILIRYKTGAAESDEDIANIFDLIPIDNTLTIIGDETDEKIWCTLRNLGYPEIAIAGIMGNIAADSNFKGGGSGLADWDDTREKNLEIYAKTKDAKKSDINTQIEYLIGEITEGGGCNGYAQYQIETVEYNNKTYNLNSWKDATTPESAAEAFAYVFKKPDKVLSDSDMEERKEKAREYYNKFSGRTIEGISGVNAKQLKIAQIAKESRNHGIKERKGYCLGWVNDVYTQAGVKVERKNCARCSGYYFGVSKDFDIIPIGAAVYGYSNDSADGKIYGHVGIYIGDGKVADNIGYIRIIKLDDWRDRYSGSCWGWTSATPVNAAYSVNKGLIKKGDGSDC